MIRFSPMGFDWKDRTGLPGKMMFFFPDDAMVLCVRKRYQSCPDTEIRISIPRREGRRAADVAWKSRQPEWRYLVELAETLGKEEDHWRSEHMDEMDKDSLAMDGYLEEPEDGFRWSCGEVEEARREKAFDALTDGRFCPISASMLVNMIWSDIFGIEGYPRAGTLEITLERSLARNLANPERYWKGDGTDLELWSALSALEYIRRQLNSAKEWMLDHFLWDAGSAAAVKKGRAAEMKMKEILG